jgi:hypothetical protein
MGIKETLDWVVAGIPYEKKRGKVELIVRGMTEIESKHSKSGIEICTLYIYYNMPEFNQYAYISKSIHDMTIKQIDKAVRLLKAWAEKEKMKQARIRAYQNMGVM